jgi:arylsulfatase
MTKPILRLSRASLFLSLLLASTLVLAQEQRPNILLIIADDLGYTDLGAYGGEIPTPNLDALAYAGVRLTNFHTGEACQQTRSMLMASRGFMSAIRLMPPLANGERTNELRQDVATLPELLRDAGYRTYMSGKWDLGLTPAASPSARGFDRSFGLLEASSSHFAEYFWDDVSFYQEDGRRLRLQELPDDFYSTISYTDKMLEYLGDHDEPAPWFGYLAYTAPHWPLQVPEEWLDRHDGKYDEGYDVLRTRRMLRAMEKGVLPSGVELDEFSPVAAPWSSLSPELQEKYTRAQEIYASMTELLDEEIGRLVDFLDATGQLDNTLIFFMSDHGASAAEIGIAPGPSSMPDHFNVVIDRHDNSLANIGHRDSFVDHGRGFGEASTAPWKYFKGALTEGGIRAAAFVHYPAAQQEAEINHTFFSVLDILPTFLELAGTSHPGEVHYNGRNIQPIAGRSFWRHVTGDSPTVHGDDNAVGWARREVGAIIKGRYKLTNQTRPGTAPANADSPWRLYDLESDPLETDDISGTHPDIVASLLREWQENWR